MMTKSNLCLVVINFAKPTTCTLDMFERSMEHHSALDVLFSLHRQMEAYKS